MCVAFVLCWESDGKHIYTFPIWLFCACTFLKLLKAIKMLDIFADSQKAMVQLKLHTITRKSELANWTVVISVKSYDIYTICTMMIPISASIDLYTVSTKQSFTPNEDNLFLGTTGMWPYCCTAMDLADCICWYRSTIDLYVPIMSNLINISPRLKAYCILRSSALRDHRCKSLTVSFSFCHHGVQLI